MNLPALRTLAAAAVLSAGPVLLAAAPASAGLIDGSLNNAHIADHSNILGVMLNSQIEDNSNSNANTRANGRGSNSQFQAAAAAACEATVTAHDPDGAHGTATVAVHGPGTEVLIRDQAPGTTWGQGDPDHFTTSLACTDPDTGEFTGLLTFPADLTAR
jgi:hypothetical protein